MEKNTCVYVHYYLDNEIPFYVGSGSKKRPYLKSKNKHNKLWNEIVKSLNYEYGIKIVYDNLSIEEASELENELILKYGRICDGGTLCNKIIHQRTSSDAGYNLTEEQLNKMQTWFNKPGVKENISECMKKNWNDPNCREKNIEAKSDWFKATLFDGTILVVRGCVQMSDKLKELGIQCAKQSVTRYSQYNEDSEQPVYYTKNGLYSPILLQYHNK